MLLVNYLELIPKEIICTFLFTNLDPITFGLVLSYDP